METSDDAVTFKDMGKDKSVSILVPHTNASSFQSIVRHADILAS
jgi:hypothetical protein